MNASLQAALMCPLSFLIRGSRFCIYAAQRPFHEGNPDAFYDAQRKIVSAIFRRGADVDACDNGGNAPLHVACFMGKSSVARCLLDNGALTNVTNGEGATPLHLASAGTRDGHHECVKVLLKFGANPRKKDDQGRTPHFVARSCMVGSARPPRAACETVTSLLLLRKRCQQRGSTDCSIIFSISASRIPPNPSPMGLSSAQSETDGWWSKITQKFSEHLSRIVLRRLRLRCSSPSSAVAIFAPSHRRGAFESPSL